MTTDRQALQKTYFETHKTYKMTTGARQALILAQAPDFADCGVPGYPRIAYDSSGRRSNVIPRPFRFLALPPEIRNKILRSIVFKHSERHIEGNFADLGFNILLTCKQIWNENKGYLTRNTWIIRHGTTFDQILPDTFTHLYPDRTFLRPLIKNVYLIIPVVHARIRTDVAAMTLWRAANPDEILFFLLPFLPRTVVAGPAIHADIYSSTIGDLPQVLNSQWRRYGMHGTYSIMFVEHDLRRYVRGLFNTSLEFLDCIILELTWLYDWMFMRNYVFNNATSFRHPRHEHETTIKTLPFASMFVAICCERPMARKIVFRVIKTNVRDFLRHLWSLVKKCMDEHRRYVQQRNIHRSEGPRFWWYPDYPSPYNPWVPETPAAAATRNAACIEGAKDRELVEGFLHLVYGWVDWKLIVERQMVMEHAFNVGVVEHVHTDEPTPGTGTVWRDTVVELDKYNERGWGWADIVMQVVDFYEWEFIDQ